VVVIDAQSCEMRISAVPVSGIADTSRQQAQPAMRPRSVLPFGEVTPANPLPWR
jgi:hypothetical protein